MNDTRLTAEEIRCFVDFFSHIADDDLASIKMSVLRSLLAAAERDAAQQANDNERGLRGAIKTAIWRFELLALNPNRTDVSVKTGANELRAALAEAQKEGT